MSKLLGKPLAWLASLGTGAVTALCFWGLAQFGIHEARTSALLFPVIVTIVAKVVGWIVATYGPKPISDAPVMAPRRTRKPVMGNRPLSQPPINRGIDSQDDGA